MKEGEEREKELEMTKFSCPLSLPLSTQALPTPYTGTTQYTIMIGQTHPL